jgi:hypothetical protein
MDIITNFAVGEEAVGAIFGSDQDKGKRKEEDPASSSWGRRGTTTRRRRRKISRTNKRPRPTTLSPLLIVRNLEDPSTGAFSTKCSRNRVPTTKGPRTTTSRTAICSGDTLKA